MSIKVYFDDFQSLSEKVEAISSTGDVAAQMYSIREMAAYEKEYSDLVGDCSDWLRTQSDYELASKLEAIFNPDERHGRPLVASELSARLRRSLRAMRTYSTSESEIVEWQSNPIRATPQQSPMLEPQSVDMTANKVFVVHGHDESMLHQVMRLLTDLGLEGIVLREQVSKGKAVIEKLEYYSNVNFAVVLMTADDFGSSSKDASSSTYQPRARQNVIMELGFFVAKLKRENVCVLKENGVEEPSDILGVVYVPIDPASAWRLTLGKELREAGFGVDLNKL